MSEARRPPVALAAVVNGAASIVAWIAFVVFLPWFESAEGPADAADRLVYAAALLAWPAAVLLAMVLGVVVARVAGQAFNPIDDAESRAYRVSQRVLQNTVEQTAVFVPALLALAATVDGRWLGTAALLTLLFVVGRVLFWAGYLVHPYARAPGMAITFNVNAGLVAWLVIGRFVV